MEKEQLTPPESTQSTESIEKKLYKIIDLYWYLLEDTKYHERYCYYQLKQTTKIVSVLNFFQAFVSCGSVSAWALWDKLDFLWAILIAISQLLTALKSHISFYKRKENLQKAYIQLLDLYQNIEQDWLSQCLSIADKNKIDENLCNTIEAIYIKYNSKLQEIINSDIDDIPNPNESFEIAAKSETKSYLKNL